MYFIFPLQDISDRFKEEEDARNNLFQNKKKLEQEVAGLKKDIEDLELNLQKSEQDKATKDHQIRNLNDEIAHQDELINKLNKEKKNQGEVNQKTAEELQAAEDKVNHLNKVKLKLEQTLDELEDSLEREKKSRYAQVLAHYSIVPMFSNIKIKLLHSRESNQLYTIILLSKLLINLMFMSNLQCRCREGEEEGGGRPEAYAGSRR